MENHESIDPTIGRFKYSEAEREKLRKEGMTDQEIDEKEARANLNLAEDQLKKESDEGNK